MIDIIVREARPDDAEAIVAIFNPVIESGKYSVLDTSLSVENEREFILKFPARGIFHVAQDRQSRALVGFQNLEPFATYTHAFDHVGVIATCVDLERRRRGIGKQLFAATFEAARRKGFEKIFTYVRADNPTALLAYLKQGFRIVGTAQRHGKFRGRYIDEIIIEKFLMSFDEQDR
jgi:L-amino acid N-acyltransferase YncA